MPTLPAARPAPADNSTGRTFSEFAEARMWNLFKNHDDQCGTIYRGPGSEGKSRTDCITYVMQVLSYAYEQVGAKDKADKVRANSKKGTDLARYLTSAGWKAYYFNPDVKNPQDGRPEHPVAYQKAVKTNFYYSIHLSGLIIDYNLTPVHISLLDRLFGKSTPRANKMEAFDALSKVKFGYGLTRGGDHTFLLSYGMIFEVHWDQIGPRLYERSPLYNFPWRDGVFVVPEDSGFSLP